MLDSTIAGPSTSARMCGRRDCRRDALIRAYLPTCRRAFHVKRRVRSVTRARESCSQRDRASSVSRETDAPSSGPAVRASRPVRRCPTATGTRPLHVKRPDSTHADRTVAFVARNRGPWDTSPRGRRRSTVTRGTVRAGATLGQSAEDRLAPMTLLLAAVGATVTALLELSVGPYLRIGTAQPHLVLVARDRRHGGDRPRGRAGLGLRWGPRA